MELLKVGELARRTGLTVRTLHHYDEIGLLTPTRRTEAGYRLYDADDVERLARILALRGLGLSLDEVRSCLDDPELSLGRVIALRIGRLREEIEERTRLLRSLEALEPDAPDGPGAPTGTRDRVDRLIETVERMTMFEKYFTEDQLETLERRREMLGEERIREAEAEWPKLIAEVRSARERGVDPESEEARELARRWQALVDEFTGGDPEIAASVRRMYSGEPATREEMGVDGDVTEFIARAKGADGGDAPKEG